MQKEISKFLCYVNLSVVHVCRSSQRTQRSKVMCNCGLLVISMYEGYMYQHIDSDYK